MEFLRFGSSIPGSYWGCCACCIIQNFKVEPDAPYGIQIVGGDGGSPLGDKFAGKTYREVFWHRLRFGTFDSRDMPNHAFLAILTENQINGSIGKQWMEILKEAGFEFIRTVTNSVYSGQSITTPGAFGDQSRNHIFGLFRNIGGGATSQPYLPPKAWTDLPNKVTEAWTLYGDVADMPKKQQEEQLVCWNALPAGQFYTEAVLEAEGVPVHYAGVRSTKPQQPKSVRKPAAKPKKVVSNAASTLDPFAPDQLTAVNEVCPCGDVTCTVGL